MNSIKLASAAAVVAALLAPALAGATTVLDSGTPTGDGLPFELNGTNFYAAEFNLAAGQTITSVEAYLTAGIDSPGDTFSIGLYQAGGFTGNFPTELFAAQASYTADGWNGLSNLSWTPGAAGQYWVALEVGSADSAIGLNLPGTANDGSVPALQFASNQGAGYVVGAPAIGLEVSAVPLPGAAWLLISGMAGFAALRRKLSAA